MVYVSRLQRSGMFFDVYLGLRPRLVCAGPLALKIGVLYTREFTQSFALGWYVPGRWP